MLENSEENMNWYLPLLKYPKEKHQFVQDETIEEAFGSLKIYAKKHMKGQQSIEISCNRNKEV